MALKITSRPICAASPSARPSCGLPQAQVDGFSRATSQGESAKHLAVPAQPPLAHCLNRLGLPTRRPKIVDHRSQKSLAETLSGTLSASELDVLKRYQESETWPEDPFGFLKPAATVEIDRPSSPDHYPAYFESFNMAPSPNWEPGSALGRDAILGELARVNIDVPVVNHMSHAIVVNVCQDNQVKTYTIGAHACTYIKIDKEQPCTIAPADQTLFLNPMFSATAGSQLNLVVETTGRPPIILPKGADASPSFYDNVPYDFARDEWKKGTSTRASIPKLLQNIWIGSDLPVHFKGKLANFRRLNPDHTMVLWTDRRPDELSADSLAFCVEHAIKLVNLEKHATALTQEAGVFAVYKRCEQHRSPVSESDVLRAVFMQAFGGTYGDCDLDWKVPLRWLTETFELVLSGRPGGKWQSCGDETAANDFFMSVPGHTFWTYVIDFFKESHNRPIRYENKYWDCNLKDYATLARTGPKALSDAAYAFVLLNSDTSAMDGVAFLSPKQVGCGRGRSLVSIADGEDGASWTLQKRMATKSTAKPFILRNDPDAEKRIAACMLDDLRDFGSIYFETYDPEFSVDPTLKERALKLLMSVL